MKVYQVVSIGGIYEDYCEYVIGTYLRIDKANEVLNTLIDNRNKAKEQYDKCDTCKYSLSNADNITAIEDDMNCNDFLLCVDNGLCYCNSPKQEYMIEFDEEYEVREVEVIE